MIVAAERSSAKKGKQSLRFAATRMV